MSELRAWELSPEIEAWPYLKWHRAMEHAQYLSARVAQFNARAAYRAPVELSEDRCTFYLLKPDGVPPPLDEWTLVFADSVHNLRVALDSLAWELSNVNDEPPSLPHLVSFPILLKESEWPKAAEILKTMPAEQLARIRGWQPFHADEPAGQVLSLLAKLDNHEKHRRTLVSTTSLQELRLDFTPGPGTFEDVEPGDEQDAGILFDPHEDPKPGEPLAEFRWPAPLKQNSPIPQFAVVGITPSARVGDLQFPAIEFLRDAAGMVKQLLDHVTKGWEPEIDGDEQVP